MCEMSEERSRKFLNNVYLEYRKKKKDFKSNDGKLMATFLVPTQAIIKIAATNKIRVIGAKNLQKLLFYFYERS